MKPILKEVIALNAIEVEANGLEVPLHKKVISFEEAGTDHKNKTSKKLRFFMNRNGDTAKLISDLNRLYEDKKINSLKTKPHTFIAGNMEVVGAFVESNLNHEQWKEVVR